MVQTILLDPSCSGSGTAATRLDHLLPSKAEVPAVERIVYSTCSIHQIENEDVIQSVLPLAESHGYQLVNPFPEWQCRGLPVFEGSENMVRTDPAKHGEDFFIALFARKDETTTPHSSIRTRNLQKKKTLVPFIHPSLFNMWLHSQLNRRGCLNKCCIGRTRRDKTTD